VKDPKFRECEFFDPLDLVQVKYEMLRRVRHDRCSVTEAARQFGFSRTAFYQTQALFEQQGLPGLMPKRPGPKEGHKLSPAVMEFVDQQLQQDESLKAVELAALVSRQFGMSVHPRSIERALSRRRKKRRP
jgi:transposase